MGKKSDFNWLELILGVVFVLVGIYTFRNPGTSLKGFVIIYGILAVISGIADVAFYVHLESRTGFGPTATLLLGILNAIVGVFLIVNSEFGAVAAVIVFPIWFIANCVSKLLNLDAVRIWGGKAQFWITLVVNIIGIILGFLLLFHPFASAVSMVYIAGAYLVIIGVASIISAFLM